MEDIKIIAIFILLFSLPFVIIAIIAVHVKGIKLAIEVFFVFGWVAIGIAIFAFATWGVLKIIEQ